MFNANFRPGEGFLLFNVYSGFGEVTSAGHPVTSKYTKTNISFYAVLAEADPREIEQSSYYSYGCTVWRRCVCQTY